MQKRLKANQQGFTLVEVLVVVGILAILLAITLIALNPTQHFQSARNTQRSSDVTAILDAVYQYEAANKGNLPPSLATVTSTPTPIGKAASGKVDPCADLVPTYLASLPLDPDSTASSVVGGPTACNAATTAYDTGYTIAKSASNRFTVSAPAAEGGATVSVTR